MGVTATNRQFGEEAKEKTQWPLFPVYGPRDKQTAKTKRTYFYEPYTPVGIVILPERRLLRQPPHSRSHDTAPNIEL